MLSPIFLAFVVALVPTLIYAWLVWWLDRYEREPGWLLITVFFWGAVPAILLSLLAEVFLQQPLEPFALGLSGDMLQVGVISPVVEELAKGLALLGIYAFVRGEIDDLLDGIVYGALVGIGFALTENFFYILNETLKGGNGWLEVAFVRAIVFGLNHAFYAAITGATVGLATFSPHRLVRWLLPSVGLLLAIVVHMVHNVSTALVAVNPAFIILSLLLDWGGILLFVVVMVLSLRQERSWINRELADEVPDVISSHYYDMAQQYGGRWGRWVALTQEGDRQRARMEAELYCAAADLAFHKHRLDLLGDEAGTDLDIQIAQLRHRLRILNRALAT